jgi:23S rRNA (pseudouridine1915-N3)-methyltransferase
MNITVIATGKCKDKAISALCETYTKRLKPYLPTTLIEFPQIKGQTRNDIKKAEAKLQNAKIPHNSFVIALDETGKMPKTTEFAKTIQKQRDQGVSNLVFIIGGADGLSSELKQKANLLMSLSSLTFPHMLVRPILLEQIYRVGTYLSGHPYHREG